MRQSRNQKHRIMGICPGYSSRCMILAPIFQLIRSAAALLPCGYYPSLIDTRRAETAPEAPSNGSLTCHFAPGSSTGR